MTAKDVNSRFKSCAKSNDLVSIHCLQGLHILVMCLCEYKIDILKWIEINERKLYTVICGWYFS